MGISSATSLLGKDIDLAFWGITGVCAVLFVVIIFFMVYLLFKYHGSRHEKAEDIEGNTTLELSFLGGSIGIVMIMFFWGWDGYKVLKTQAPQDAVVIKATAQTWAWSFEYPNGKQSGTLIVPYKKPVRMVLHSRDMIHGFFIPSFRVKQDVVPGAEKTTWFTPDALGTFDLFCTQYCGTGHSGMITKAVVVSEADYNSWTGGTKEISAAPGPAEAKTAKAPAKGAAAGKELYQSKGCSACHSIDGSRIIGPSFKGIYGSKVKVTTNGKEREVVVDDAYITKSELEPQADVVVGFQPVMPPQKGVLNDEEIKSIIEFIKSLK